MIKPVFYLNGIRITEPINYQSLELEVNFDLDDPSYRGRVSTNRWELGLGDLNDNNDGTKNALGHITGGLTGGVGVFEGIPFKIELEDEPNGTQTIFDGYLDLSTADITCSRISANAIESGGIDWFNDIVDSFDFEYLYNLNDGEAGKISRADFVNIPYILSDIPDYKEAAIISLSSFVVISELLDQLQSTVEQPVGALFANPGDIITFIIRIISIILLVLSIVNLLIQLIQVLVQFTKFHAGMYLFTLCQRGAEYLGLEFKSDSILEADDWRNVALLPEKYEQFDNDISGQDDRVEQINRAILGYLTASDVDGMGYYKGTYGQLLRDLKDMFNAKIIFEGDVVRLEKLDYVNAESVYQLPDIDRKDIPYRFNAEDFISNYGISFAPDGEDKQSLNNWNGSKVIITSRPNLINNKSNVIARNERKINIPFARGKRNTKVSFIESMVREYVDNVKDILNTKSQLLDAASDGISNLIKKQKKFLKAIKLVSTSTASVPVLPPVPPVNLSQIAADLEDYIFRKSDSLIMESDFLTTPKLVMMEADFVAYKDEAVVKLSNRNDEVLNAQNIYNNFHSLNSFVGERDAAGNLTSKHNQYKEYTLNDIPFCIDDYKKVKGNNIILDADGITKGEIVSLQWNPFRQTANITFKVNERYTDNLTETIITSDGR